MVCCEDFEKVGAETRPLGPKKFFSSSFFCILCVIFTILILYSRIFAFFCIALDALRTYVARITRLPRIARFTRNIRFTRCENCKILAKSEYDEQISKYSRYMDCATSSACVWLCENYIDKVSKKTMTLTMPLWPMRMVHR